MKGSLGPSLFDSVFLLLGLEMNRLFLPDLHFLCMVPLVANSLRAKQPWMETAQVSLPSFKRIFSNFNLRGEVPA